MIVLISSGTLNEEIGRVFDEDDGFDKTFGDCIELGFDEACAEVFENEIPGWFESEQECTSNNLWNIVFLHPEQKIKDGCFIFFDS